MQTSPDINNAPSTVGAALIVALFAVGIIGCIIKYIDKR